MATEEVLEFTHYHREIASTRELAEPKNNNLVELVDQLKRLAVQSKPVNWTEPALRRT